MSTTQKFESVEQALEAYKLGGRDKQAVVEQAKAEVKAQAAAKKAKKRLPAAPANDAIKQAHEMGLNGGRSKRSGGTGKGRAVRFDDAELVKMVRAAVESGEARTAGGCVKHFRAIGKGSNEKRVKRAWDQAIADGMTVPAKSDPEPEQPAAEQPPAADDQPSTEGLADLLPITGGKRRSRGKAS